jgi:hypothetical protein
VGPWVRKRVQYLSQALNHAIDVLADVGIRKSYGRVTAMAVHLITYSVSRRIVGITVNFDDQRLLRTEEVYNAIANDMLPAKLEAAELRSRDMTPDGRFERRRSSPQPLRSLE